MGTMIVVAGLVSAIVYGISDFLGGLAARGIPAILVSLVSFVVAAVPIAIVTPLLGSVWSTEAVVLGALAGVLGAGAMWAFFAALVVLRERLRAAQWAGVVLALAASVVLVFG